LQLSLNRYATGVEKLQKSDAEIIVMREELESLQPAMAKATEEARQLMEGLTKETAESMEMREAVKSEELILKEAAALAQEDQLATETALAAVAPALSEASSKLDELSASEISEAKQMANAPAAVKFVFEVLCILQNIPPVRVHSSKGDGTFVEDYWEAAKKNLISDMNLLKNLKDYNCDDIPAPIMKAVRAYTAKPEWDLAKIRKASKAAHGIANWISAVDRYDEVVKSIRPTQDALIKSRANCEAIQASLNIKLDELAKVDAKMAVVKASLTESQANKQRMETLLSNNNAKIARAVELTQGLGGEVARWIAKRDQLLIEQRNVVGDSVISAAFITYLGPFTQAYRQVCTTAWTGKCKEVDLFSSEKFSFQQIVGDPLQIRQWTVDGLPSDQLSVDNALIISKSRRWPLIIDPQKQANRWIKSIEKANKLIVIRASDDFHRSLENAINYGIPCLLEDLGQTLDPGLDGLLNRKLVKKGNIVVLKMADKDLDYSSAFKFYMTTKLANPLYDADVSAKVTLINFALTSSGLQDQLLSIAVATEKPALEIERFKLIEENAKLAVKIQEIEDKILKEISESPGNILEDERTVFTLTKSKTLANENLAKQSAQVEAEANLEQTRLSYSDVASHAAIMYMCILELSGIDPMYQFSLNWFINIFKQSITECSSSSFDGATRLRNINLAVNSNVRRSVEYALFAKDRVAFSFLLTVRLLIFQKCVTREEWSFFISSKTISNRN